MYHVQGRKEIVRENVSLYIEYLVQECIYRAKHLPLRISTLSLLFRQELYNSFYGHLQLECCKTGLSRKFSCLVTTSTKY